MKKHLKLLFILLVINTAYSQNLKIGTTIGSGFFALEEHNDKNLNMSFSTPLSFSLSVSILDNNNSFGLKTLYADSRVEGNNWLTNEKIDGLVSLSNYFGYYEKFWVKNKLSHSFLFGLGYTNENYLTQLESQPKIRTYASLLLGYSLNYSITDRLNLRTKITPLVTDVFNGFRYFLSDWEGQSVGEDIHLLISFGIDYKLYLSK